MPDPPVQGSPAGPQPLAWYYAGFWWRLLAWLIDAVLLLVADQAIGLRIGWLRVGVRTTVPPDDGPVSNVANWTYSVSAPDANGWMTLATVLVGLAYFSLLESSRWQATPGKLACRLRVTDGLGHRIGLGRAIGRNLGKLVSGFVLCIGFLMVGWTRRKQGLHDLMADTLVLRRRPAAPLFGFQPPQPPQPH